MKLLLVQIRLFCVHGQTYGKYEITFKYLDPWLFSTTQPKKHWFASGEIIEFSKACVKPAHPLKLLSKFVSSVFITC